ncbi:MAG: hypothetical protein M5U34_14595 [Chloroflexi bacterium]|nr:hypothetical protein [Chloroflexota bacterium]
MVESATFCGTAVFAASPHHLYRIAGDWIMQGKVQNGHFVETAIATAHRQQTWFRASPPQRHAHRLSSYFCRNPFLPLAQRKQLRPAYPSLAARRTFAGNGR